MYPPAPKERKRKAGRRKAPGGAHERVIAVAFVLPAFLVYVVFMLVPFLTSIFYSFTDWNGAAKDIHLVGLDNYARLASDSELLESLWHNVIFLVGGTLPPIMLGLLLALAIWGGVRLGAFWRVLYFIPFVLASIVVAISWTWIYNPLFGPLNEALEGLGLGDLTHSWLGDAGTALPAVLVVSAWVSFGFIMVLALAALQAVDGDVVDAALVDGAGWWQRLWHVILPQIAPAMTLIWTIMLAYAIGTFDLVFVMTKGGPGTSSELIATYAYRVAFRSNEIGYGSTVTLLITVLSLGASIIFVRLRERSYS
jgi:raffinose/stachyose/melibiose transport system permease protein